MIISLSGPTFVLYWINSHSHSLYGENLDHVTSALAPAIIALIACSFIAEVLAGVFRGCIHASVVCFLADREMFMENQRYTGADLLSQSHYTNRSANNISMTGVIDDKSMVREKEKDFEEVNPASYSITDFEPPVRVVNINDTSFPEDRIRNNSPIDEIIRKESKPILMYV